MKSEQFMKPINPILTRIFFMVWIITVLLSCSEYAEEMNSLASVEESSFETENVVVVVIDGPRFSETWGQPEKKYIPKMANELAPQGTFFADFRNEGNTRTISGHSAITTGHYLYMANDGSEYPREPSFFQYYLQQTAQAPDQACIVTSKPKLNILADSRKTAWRGRYNPYFNCGKWNEKRPDAETLEKALEELRDKKPRLMLLQFMGPDYHAHRDNWEGYLQSIQETDRLVAQLWQFLQEHPFYKNKTALFVTNDHGRHGNGHKDGFQNHGDKCGDCSHISLLALGPDFARGKVVRESYDLTDIAPTIAALMGFSLPDGDGKPISPLLINPGI